MRNVRWFILYKYLFLFNQIHTIFKGVWSHSLHCHKLNICSCLSLAIMNNVSKMSIFLMVLKTCDSKLEWILWKFTFFRLKLATGLELKNWKHCNCLQVVNWTVIYLKQTFSKQHFCFACFSAFLISFNTHKCCKIWEPEWSCILILNFQSSCSWLVLTKSYNFCQFWFASHYFLWGFQHFLFLTKEAKWFVCLMVKCTAYCLMWSYHLGWLAL